VATPPTFVASYGNTAWSAATQTASVTVQAGDLIVVAAGTGNSNVVVNTPTGGGLTFTVQQSVVSVTQQANAYLWTATSPTAQTFTLTMSGNDIYAWFAEVWRNHGGIGASAKKTAATTTSVSLTTQGANSALVFADADYYGINGSTRTYLTSVGSFAEKAYQFAGDGVATFYAGHYADSGAVGSKTAGMSAPSGQHPSLFVLEVLAAPVVVVSGSLAITATALSSNVPPAARVDINDTRSPGQATQLTVMRTNPDGTQTVVRTVDGNPLQLSSGTGTLYDYEMPLGSPVSYTTIEVPGISSLQVTVSSSLAWLVHPGVPSLSQPISHFLPGSFAKRTATVARGVFHPMGRANAVVFTDGARKGADSSFTILTTSDTQRTAIESLLADASTLLLNIPVALGYNIKSRYVAIGDVDYGPVVDKVVESWFTMTLPFSTVDRPAGGVQSSRTWSDILAGYGSWSAVLAQYKTWQDVLTGP
jgi:hypothetical protein